MPNDLLRSLFSFPSVLFPYGILDTDLVLASLGFAVNRHYPTFNYINTLLFLEIKLNQQIKAFSPNILYLNNCFFFGQLNFNYQKEASHNLFEGSYQNTGIRNQTNTGLEASKTTSWQSIPNFKWLHKSSLTSQLSECCQCSLQFQRSRGALCSSQSTEMSMQSGNTMPGVQTFGFQVCQPHLGKVIEPLILLAGSCFLAKQGI